jgi:hypothetical protein
MRTQGVRHMFGALDMNRNWMYGHVKSTKNRTTFLEFCRYLRSLYPPEVRLAVVCDNYSPHLSTSKDDRVGVWAANNVEIAYVPTNASYLNRIECHFWALRYFALNGTDHRSHEEHHKWRSPTPPPSLHSEAGTTGLSAPQRSQHPNTRSSTGTAGSRQPDPASRPWHADRAEHPTTDASNRESSPTRHYEPPSSNFR